MRNLTLLLTTLFLLIAGVSNAQYVISGPSSVCPGDQNVAYNVEDSQGGIPSGGRWVWSLNGSVVATGIFVNIDFPSSGSSWSLTIGTLASKTVYGNSDNPGSISLTSGVCSTTATVDASGYSGSLKWQVKTGSGAWTDYGLGFSEPLGYTVSAGTQYQFRVRTNNSCATQYSNTVTLNPIAYTNAGTVSGSKTICYNASGGTLTGSSPSGGSGGYSYAWEKKTTGSWSTISGATSSTYNTGNLVITTQFRRKVTDAVCGSDYSNNAVTVTVTPPATGYSMTGGGSYCSGGSGVAVGLSLSQTGTTYQLKRNGSNVGSPIAGTGGQISWGNQTVAGTYTATATKSGCSINMAGSAVVSISPLPIQYSFTGGGSYCSGGSGVNIGLADSQSGVNYQLKLGGSNVGSPVAGTGSAISFGTKTTVGSYSVVATNTSTNCVKAYTNSVSVSTYSLPSAPSITAPSLVCYNSTVSITSSNSSSDKWYTVSGGGTPFHTGISYSPTLTSTTTYYVEAINSNGCASSTRTPVTITVSAITNGGSVNDTVDGATVTAFGMESGTLQLSGQTGTILKWQYKTTGDWIDITSTQSTYNYQNVDEPTYYRAYVQSGPCTPEYSTQTFVNVLQVPTVGLGVTSEVRPGFGTTLSTDAGHSGYVWYKDGVIIPNENGNTYQATHPGLYRVKVTNATATYETGDITINSQLEYDQNSVIIHDFRNPGYTSSVDVFSLDKDDVSISADIMDGLGRLQQKVSVESSPLGYDMIAPVEYDEYGRTVKNYLPYVDTDKTGLYKDDALTAVYANSNQYAFHNTLKGTTVPFSESKLEASPLNRVIEQGASGEGWQLGENTVTINYDFNDTLEVIEWDYDALMTMSADKYLPNTLSKTTSTDEDGNQMIEFQNNSGQTILKKAQVNTTDWTETYYIYDDYGQLRVVLPPEATDRLGVEFFGATTQNKTDFLDRWAFQYDYDGRNRMISKKVPGAAIVFMVYDKWDRLVLTQDGNQRGKSTPEWLFTKYDQLNRPIITGIMSSSATEATIRSNVVAESDRYDTLDAAGTNQYSNLTYPNNTLVDTYLTVTYYDTYAFQSHTNWTSASLAFSDPESINTQNTNVKGQVTGAMTKVADGTWIRSVSYYDDRYRPIQSQSTNHLGGKDVVTNYYDFIGQVTRTISSHNDGSETTTIERDFVYDHAGRLLETWHQLNAEDSILIAENSYNELGELIEKDLHGETGGAFAQSLDYDYNVRGWLTAINDAALTSAGDTNTDLFGMELLYSTVDGSLSNTGLYNGNISAMKWSNNDTEGGSIDERAFTYGYDKLNRLTAASHFEDDVSTNKYGVSGLTYDLNGNIEALKRRSTSTTAYMDDLAYDYVGNQLQYVNDLSSDSLGFDNNGTGTSLDYTYDANGNMGSDANKEIDSIYYNHLNLPTLVDFETSGDSIAYLYDAAGIKLQQKVWEDDTLRKTTDYVGEFIYEDGLLQLIQHEEGRIVLKTEKVAPDVIWQFDSGAEGFTPNFSISNFQQASPGHIEGTLTDVNGSVFGPENLNIDASKYDKVRIRIENNTSSNMGWFFFKTTTGTIWASSRHKIISVVPNSGYTEYVLDMSTLSTWEGTITQLRIDPARNATGDFKIDWVIVEAKSEVSEDYQYHLKDHLGNTRLTFSTTPENYTLTETFETGEENGFQELHRHTNANANTTAGGNEVARLQSGETGAMIFLSLNKGDTVDLNVQANYESAPSGNTFLQTGYNALFTAFDNVYGGAEGVTSTATEFNDAISGTDMTGKGNTSTAPRAFLNYIIFDKDMNYEKAGFEQISTSASGVGVHENVVINDIIAELDGYLLAYLSNENSEAVDVHFDDFTVYHGKTNVVQSDDYYPFGLTFNGYSRTASTVNRFKYNGYEYIPELTWTDYGARFYDAAIGRWNAVDPLAEAYNSYTSYGYVRNNPTNLFDIAGMADNQTLDEWAAKKEAEWAAIDAGADPFKVFGPSSTGGSNDSRNLNEKKKDDPIDPILDEYGIGVSKEKILFPKWKDYVDYGMAIIKALLVPSKAGGGLVNKYDDIANVLNTTGDLINLADGGGEVYSKHALNKYSSARVADLENYANILSGISDKLTSELNDNIDTYNNLPASATANGRIYYGKEIHKLKDKLYVVGTEYNSVKILIHVKLKEALQQK